MQKLFSDTRELDAKCRETFLLTEDLMMENAASSLEDCVRRNSPGKKVLVLCGSGNNGADGYALARRISGDYETTILECGKPKSELCKTQSLRSQKSKAKILISLPSDEELSSFSCVVDCIFGSGFHGSLPEEISSIVNKVNLLSALRISCDLPSGLDSLGNAEGTVFKADKTVTMGALKLSLFSDFAKDAAGQISISNLGVSKRDFESLLQTEAFLLEKEDILLPLRKNQNVHKGSFGHVAVFSGEKIGASVIAGCAALRFGAGLVTLVGTKNKSSVAVSEDGFLSDDENISFELMYSSQVPENISSAACGMGLGRGSEAMNNALDFLLSKAEIPCVLDADVFYEEKTVALLRKKSELYKTDGKSMAVITPHPKEFVSLLKLCSLGDFSVDQVVKNRIELAKKVSSLFPGVVLLLKGANPIIVFTKKENEESQIFINPLGTQALAKAGSGDVLSGLTAALLSQGYDALEAAKTASLSHALASRKAENNFSLTPFQLIRNIGGCICSVASSRLSCEAAKR